VGKAFGAGGHGGIIQKSDGIAIVTNNQALVRLAQQGYLPPACPDLTARRR